MTNPQTEARAMPDLPDDDSDFTPDLARKIIELYQAALAAKDAELAAVKEMYAREGAKAMHEAERAERAEAQLAEARKALEQAEQQIDYGQVDAAHQILIRATRRALTGGQNG